MIQTVRNVLQRASQAEILRSHQKDDKFVGGLREKLLNLLQLFKNSGPLLRILQSQGPVEILYRLFTSLLDNQTLGEEYTGIVQVNMKKRKIPSSMARILDLLLDVFGEKILMSILDQLKKSVNNRQSNMRPEAVLFFNVQLNKLKNAIPVMIFANKALFYIYGHSYSFSHLITGIDYAKVYGKRPMDSVNWCIKLLGYATLIQCALRLYQSEQTNDINTKSTTIRNDGVIKCQLCFESTPTTVTPCGHLFCWNCLGDWVGVRPQCPYCRECVTPSRIVHLMNL